MTAIAVTITLIWRSGYSVQATTLFRSTDCYHLCNDSLFAFILAPVHKVKSTKMYMFMGQICLFYYFQQMLFFIEEKQLDFPVPEQINNF